MRTWRSLCLLAMGSLVFWAAGCADVDRRMLGYRSDLVGKIGTWTKSDVQQMYGNPEGPAGARVWHISRRSPDRIGADGLRFEFDGEGYLTAWSVVVQSRPRPGGAPPPPERAPVAQTVQPASPAPPPDSPVAPAKPPEPPPAPPLVTRGGVGTE